VNWRIIFRLDPELRPMQGLRVEHLVRGMIALLIVLATMLLGVGERSAALTCVSLVALAVSAYVTDSAGMFQLKQTVANCAALGVVVVSAANAYHIDRHGQLLAVADLQSYLQYVLLFQRKTPRVYWQLALLSLGQMAIASTLVPGPMFGFMLLLYVFVGIITFALLSLDTSQRWLSLAAGRQGFVPPAKSSRAPILNGNSLDPNCLAIGRGLLRQGVFISLVTVVIAAVLFSVLPRWDVPNREVASREPLRSVGFTKTVTLGELGEVVQNADLVMRVGFFHGYDSKPFRLIGEPLFRGTVVTRYESGAWSQPQATSPMVMSAETKSHFVRQKISVEPLDAVELCCVFPVFGIQSDSRLRVSTHRDQLIRQEDYRYLPLEFEVGTTGIVNDRQRRFLPCRSMPNRWEMQELIDMPHGRNPQVDAFAGLRATTARVLSERNIDSKNRVATAEALSNYLSGSGEYFYSLEAQRRDPSLDPLEDFVTTHRLGHCEYFSGALVMMLRSQGIPARIAIGFKGGEWNPLGMYYQVQQLHAHAWVEVLLDQPNIPADAFEGEELPSAAWLVLDPTEGAQDVGSTVKRASLWGRVKQYVDYAHVLWSNYVVGMNSKRQQQEIYGPLAEEVSSAGEAVVSPKFWKAHWRTAANSRIGVFWQWYRSHWFSPRGCLVAILFSLVVIVLAYVSRWMIRFFVHRPAVGAVRAPRGLALLEVQWRLESWSRRRQLSRRAGLAGTVLSVSALLVAWVFRRLIGILRWFGLVGDAGSPQAAPVLEMYRRLEAALARRGIERHPGQTAYEFAAAAGGDLAEDTQQRRVAHLPRRIVEAFYRVRFGGRTLDKSEVDAVEHALAELEMALAISR
jgi:hypothetical protein